MPFTQLHNKMVKAYRHYRSYITLLTSLGLLSCFLSFRLLILSASLFLPHAFLYELEFLWAGHEKAHYYSLYIYWRADIIDIIYLLLFTLDDIRRFHIISLLLRLAFLLVSQALQIYYHFAQYIIMCVPLTIDIFSDLPSLAQHWLRFIIDRWLMIDFGNFERYMLLALLHFRVTEYFIALSMTLIFSYIFITFWYWVSDFAFILSIAGYSSRRIRLSRLWPYVRKDDIIYHHFTLSACSAHVILAKPQPLIFSYIAGLITLYSAISLQPPATAGQYGQPRCLTLAFILPALLMPPAVSITIVFRHSPKLIK